MSRVRTVVLLTLALFCASSGRARAAIVSPTFHVVGQGGWRVAIDTYDRASGFQAVGGGGEIAVGAVWGWIGFAAGGRVRVSPVGGDLLLEAGGSLALQILAADRVRLLLGGEGGRAFLLPGGSPSGVDETPYFAGGFVEALFDIAQFGGGRTGLVFGLRLDLDTFLTAAGDSRLPALSPAIAVGFGFRY